MKNELGKRMKIYEEVVTQYLTPKMPVIIRVDGRAFHTFTKGFERPFDSVFKNCMSETAKFLASEIPGCKLAYVQSDEISLLLVYDKDKQSCWFDGSIQKIASTAAALATLAFNKSIIDSINLVSDEQKELLQLKKLTAIFDGRVFVLPDFEVYNYFFWRQSDCIRNSIASVAQNIYSQKEINGLSSEQVKEKLIKDSNGDINWKNYSAYEKYGAIITRQEYLKNGTVRHKWDIDNELDSKFSPAFINDLLSTNPNRDKNEYKTAMEKYINQENIDNTNTIEALKTI